MKRKTLLILITSLVMVLTMAVPAWADTGGEPGPTDPIDVMGPAEPADPEDPEAPPEGPAEDSSEDAATSDTTAAPTTKPTTKPTAATTEPKILTGWQTIKGAKYYYDKNGKPVTGIRKIGSKVYSFTATGKLNTGASGKMDVKAYSNSSSTKYMILVNCSTHRVGVYKGKKHAWKRIYYWKCGDGKKSTPTVKGKFKTGVYLGRKYKQRYFDSHGARCWYATRIYNGYLFHSVLYKKAKTPKKIKDGRLGKGVSHGCVRLKLKNAKWIYKNIPKKTKVIIY